MYGWGEFVGAVNENNIGIKVLPFSEKDEKYWEPVAEPDDRPNKWYGSSVY